MRHSAVLAILALTVFTLVTCGGDDSGKGSALKDMPADILDPDPSSDVPALVDTKGMTVAQLEAKVEEVEALHDAKMEEMEKYAPKTKGAATDPEVVRVVMQINADMRALREQMMAYEKAIDALER